MNSLPCPRTELPRIADFTGLETEESEARRRRFFDRYLHAPPPSVNRNSGGTTMLVSSGENTVPPKFGVVTPGSFITYLGRRQAKGGRKGTGERWRERDGPELMQGIELQKVPTVLEKATAAIPTRRRGRLKKRTIPNKTLRGLNP